jgi:hypothetical protein
LIREKLTGLDFDAKRQALAMLGIKVWLDSNSVEITGVIPVNDGVALQPYSGLWLQAPLLPFSFKLPAQALVKH